MAGHPRAELNELPATEQLRLFGSGDVSPVEVLEAQIAKAGAVEGVVNAYSATHFDEAFERAREAERRWSSGETRPLEGLTVAVKDEHDVAGWVTRNGCANFAERVAPRHHPMVERLLEAGAVLHAQTQTPELSLLCTTWSEVGGVTRHPADPSRSPGGSSGGSAAALAAGTASLATGSDMAGSIRVPAALCGLYGLKPAFARVPSAPEDAGLFYASDGPLARTLDDLLLLHSVMCGAAPRGPELLDEARVAFDLDLGSASVDGEVRNAFERDLDTLAEQGVHPEELDLGLDGEEVAEHLWAGLFTSSLRNYLDEATRGGLETMTGYARRYVERAAAVTADDGQRCAAFAADVAARLDALWGAGYRALVCPTVVTRRVPPDLDPFGPPLMIDGREVSPELGWVLTPVFNLTNRLPVLTVPSGLQLVAPDEPTLFALAALLAS